MRKFVVRLFALGVCALGALPAMAGEKLYANVRGWKVIVNTNGDGSFNRCLMQLGKPAEMLRLATTGSIWTLSVPSAGYKKPQVAGYGFDQGEMTGTQANVDVKAGRAWFELPPSVVNRMMDASTIEVDVGKVSYQYPLSGSAAAVVKMEECAARHGPGMSKAKRAGKELPVAAPEPESGAGVESDAMRLGIGCPKAGLERSPGSEQAEKVTFTNAADMAINVYWLDFSGNPIEYEGLLPGESVTLDSFVGHKWIAKDFDGTCHGGLLQVAAGGSSHTLY